MALSAHDEYLPLAMSTRHSSLVTCIRVKSLALKSHLYVHLRDHITHYTYAIRLMPVQRLKHLQRHSLELNFHR